MGNNEIRLRKQRLNPGRIARHRDYAELLRRHKRGLKTKQLLLVAIYIVIVLMLILLSFIAIRLEKEKEKKKAGHAVVGKDISISTQLPLPWSDDQFSFSPDNPKT